VAPGPLRRALTEIRRTGIACAREEMRLGSQSVASPVDGPIGPVVAAIAVVLSSGWGNVRRLGAAARTAAISTPRSLQEHAVADQADPRSTGAGPAEEYGRTN
jgi:DNA-binding IclR family transcriptional regulator